MRLSIALPLVPFLGAALSSCGLVKLPFKVAGAVIEGTADVGKSTYNASRKAFAKTDEEKAEDARKAASKKEEEAREEKAKRAAEAGDPATSAEGSATGTGSADDSLPPLPAAGEPLPDDATLPYEVRP